MFDAESINLSGDDTDAYDNTVKEGYSVPCAPLNVFFEELI